MNIDPEHRLSQINSEVKQFHPILNKLFKKMSSVTHVEYTHGSDERGADFILERTDSLLNETSNVGIIAKIGNIGLKDLAVLCMQIDQCKLDRPFKSARQKIHLNEIWIVTNGTISHKSEEAIFEKYRNQNIHFISKDKLIELITKVFPSFWSEIDIDAGDYLATKVAEVDRLDNSLSLVPGLDATFYIDQNILRLSDVTEFRKNKRRKRPVPVDICLELYTNRLIFIEGDAGVGKSKLLRQIVKYCAIPENYQKYKLIPVLTTARELFIESNSNIDDVIIKNLGGSVDLMEKGENNITVLIDGLDEVKASSEALVEYLEGVRAYVSKNQNTRILVCSRSVGSNQLEEKDLLKWTRLELYPLTTAQLFSFVRHMCKDLEKENRIFEDIKNSKLFTELPKNPIAAILFAEILRQKVDELPSTLPELYAKYFEVVLGRWEINKGLQSVKEYESIEAILMRISSFMLNNQLDVISYEDALAHFGDYLADRNLGLKAEDLLSKLSDRFEIVVVDHLENKFMFKHKTFMEFLHAKQLQREEGVKITPNVYDLYWVNTFYFYVGLKKDCPALLSDVIKTQPSSDFARWTKIDVLANYMLAAYSTPYDIIEKCFRSAVDEAVEILHDAIVSKKGRASLPLPEMTLLWLMQYSFKLNYGYKFFKGAVEKVALDYAEEMIEDEKKAFGLFLLNMSYIKITGSEDFNYILDAKLSKIPLCVELGMKHEGETFKLKDAKYKKFDKRLKKFLASDSAAIAKGKVRPTGPGRVKRLIDTMYDTPLALRDADGPKKGG